MRRCNPLMDKVILISGAVSRCSIGCFQLHRVAAIASSQPTVYPDSFPSVRLEDCGEESHREDSSGAHEHNNDNQSHFTDRNHWDKRWDLGNVAGRHQQLLWQPLRGSDGGSRGLEAWRHSIFGRHRVWPNPLSNSSWNGNQWSWALRGFALMHTKAAAEVATEVTSAPKSSPPRSKPCKRAPVDMATIPATKLCPDCQHDLPAKDFSWRTTSPDGLDFLCRGCRAVQSYDARGRTFPGLLVDSKMCKSCKEVRPGTFFAASSVTGDGLQTRCRTCAAKVNAARLVRLVEARAEAAPYEDPPPTTICTKCARELPTEVFPKDKYSATGRTPTCPECNYERVRRRRRDMAPPLKPAVEAKRCSLCREAKPAAEFYYHAYSTDGLTYRCRVCWNERQRRYRGAGKDLEAIGETVTDAQKALCSEEKRNFT